MAVIDSIERSMTLPCSRDRVWNAISTAKGLSKWFGPHVDLERKVGGRFNMRWDNGDETTGQVETIDEPNTFAYRWYAEGTDTNEPMGEDNSTLVTFNLEDDDEGTKLTVIETGFASLPEEIREKVHKGNVRGWQIELDELRDYLQLEEA